ncbi:MAG TPA: SPASM domain-containing protein, partial [Methanolinea sp.]|nr:SPASM domain-containing protein [Methanolinea sp.]
VMRPDVNEVVGVVDLGESLGVKDYQVFFPVPTGRARGSDIMNPLVYEDLIRGVLERYRDAPLHIRPTCAPQFRRIADELGIENPTWGRGCIAGITYCRIYANGDVTPCPYLPISAGNVREQSFAEIWHHSEVFSTLRDISRLTGKCGRCHYRSICGGCRARAYQGGRTVSTGWCDGLALPAALQGEMCGEDPWCPYEPGEFAE